MPERRFPQPRSAEELEGLLQREEGRPPSYREHRDYRSCYGNKTLSRQIDINAVKRRLRKGKGRREAGPFPK